MNLMNLFSKKSVKAILSAVLAFIMLSSTVVPVFAQIYSDPDGIIESGYDFIEWENDEELYALQERLNYLYGQNSTLYAGLKNKLFVKVYGTEEQYQEFCEKYDTTLEYNKNNPEDVDALIDSVIDWESIIVDIVVNSEEFKTRCDKTTDFDKEVATMFVASSLNFFTIKDANAPVVFGEDDEAIKLYDADTLAFVRWCINISASVAASEEERNAFLSIFDTFFSEENENYTFESFASILSSTLYNEFMEEYGYEAPSFVLFQNAISSIGESLMSYDSLDEYILYWKSLMEHECLSNPSFLEEISSEFSEFLGVDTCLSYTSIYQMTKSMYSALENPDNIGVTVARSELIADILKEYGNPDSDFNEKMKNLNIEKSALDSLVKEKERESAIFENELIPTYEEDKIMGPSSDKTRMTVSENTVSATSYSSFDKKFIELKVTDDIVNETFDIIANNVNYSYVYEKIPTGTEFTQNTNLVSITKTEGSGYGGLWYFYGTGTFKVTLKNIPKDSVILIYMSGYGDGSDLNVDLTGLPVEICEDYHSGQPTLFELDDDLYLSKFGVNSKFSITLENKTDISIPFSIDDWDALKDTSLTIKLDDDVYYFKEANVSHDFDFIQTLKIENVSAGTHTLEIFYDRKATSPSIDECIFALNPIQDGDKTAYWTLVNGWKEAPEEYNLMPQYIELMNEYIELMNELVDITYEYWQNNGYKAYGMVETKEGSRKYTSEICGKDTVVSTIYPMASSSGQFEVNLEEDTDISIPCYVKYNTAGSYYCYLEAYVDGNLFNTPVLSIVDGDYTDLYRVDAGTEDGMTYESYDDSTYEYGETNISLHIPAGKHTVTFIYNRQGAPGAIISNEEMWFDISKKATGVTFTPVGANDNENSELIKEYAFKELLPYIFYILNSDLDIYSIAYDGDMSGIGICILDAIFAVKALLASRVEDENEIASINATIDELLGMFKSPVEIYTKIQTDENCLNQVLEKLMESDVYTEIYGLYEELMINDTALMLIYPIIYKGYLTAYYDAGLIENTQENLDKINAFGNSMPFMYNMENQINKYSNEYGSDFANTCYDYFYLLCFDSAKNKIDELNIELTAAGDNQEEIDRINSEINNVLLAFGDSSYDELVANCNDLRNSYENAVIPEGAEDAWNSWVDFCNTSNAEMNLFDIVNGYNWGMQTMFGIMDGDDAPELNEMTVILNSISEVLDVFASYIDENKYNDTLYAVIEIALMILPTYSDYMTTGSLSTIGDLDLFKDTIGNVFVLDNLFDKARQKISDEKKNEIKEKIVQYGEENEDQRIYNENKEEIEEIEPRYNELKALKDAYLQQFIVSDAEMNQWILENYGQYSYYIPANLKDIDTAPNAIGSGKTLTLNMDNKNQNSGSANITLKPGESADLPYFLPQTVNDNDAYIKIYHYDPDTYATIYDLENYSSSAEDKSSICTLTNGASSEICYYITVYNSKNTIYNSNLSYTSYIGRNISNSSVYATDNNSINIIPKSSDIVCGENAYTLTTEGNSCSYKTYHFDITTTEPNTTIYFNFNWLTNASSSDRVTCYVDNNSKFNCYCYSYPQSYSAQISDVGTHDVAFTVYENNNNDDVQATVDISLKEVKIPDKASVLYEIRNNDSSSSSTKFYQTYKITLENEETITIPYYNNTYNSIYMYLDGTNSQFLTQRTNGKSITYIIPAGTHYLTIGGNYYSNYSSDYIRVVLDDRWGPATFENPSITLLYSYDDYNGSYDSEDNISYNNLNFTISENIIKETDKTKYCEDMHGKVVYYNALTREIKFAWYYDASADTLYLNDYKDDRSKTEIGTLPDDVSVYPYTCGSIKLAGLGSALGDSENLLNAIATNVATVAEYSVQDITSKAILPITAKNIVVNGECDIPAGAFTNDSSIKITGDGSLRCWMITSMGNVTIDGVDVTTLAVPIDSYNQTVGTGINESQVSVSVCAGITSGGKLLIKNCDIDTCELIAPSGTIIIDNAKVDINQNYTTELRGGPINTNHLIITDSQLNVSTKNAYAICATQVDANNSEIVLLGNKDAQNNMRTNLFGEITDNSDNFTYLSGIVYGYSLDLVNLLGFTGSTSEILAHLMDFDADVIGDLSTDLIGYNGLSITTNNKNDFVDSKITIKDFYNGISSSSTGSITKSYFDGCIVDIDALAVGIDSSVQGASTIGALFEEVIALFTGSGIDGSDLLSLKSGAWKTNNVYSFYDSDINITAPVGIRAYSSVGTGYVKYTIYPIIFALDLIPSVLISGFNMSSIADLCVKINLISQDTADDISEKYYAHLAEITDIDYDKFNEEYFGDLYDKIANNEINNDEIYNEIKDFITVKTGISDKLLSVLSNNSSSSGLFSGIGSALDTIFLIIDSGKDSILPIVFVEEKDIDAIYQCLYGKTYGEFKELSEEEQSTIMQSYQNTVYAEYINKFYEISVSEYNELTDIERYNLINAVINFSDKTYENLTDTEILNFNQAVIDFEDAEVAKISAEQYSAILSESFKNKIVDGEITKEEFVEKLINFSLSETIENAEKAGVMSVSEGTSDSGKTNSIIGIDTLESIAGILLNSGITVTANKCIDLLVKETDDGKYVFNLRGISGDNIEEIIKLVYGIFDYSAYTVNALFAGISSKATSSISTIKTFLTDKDKVVMILSDKFNIIKDEIFNNIDFDSEEYVIDIDDYEINEDIDESAAWIDAEPIIESITTSINSILDKISSSFGSIGSIIGTPDSSDDDSDTGILSGLLSSLVPGLITTIIGDSSDIVSAKKIDESGNVEYDCYIIKLDKANELKDIQFTDIISSDKIDEIYEEIINPFVNSNKILEKLDILSTILASFNFEQDYIYDSYENVPDNMRRIYDDVEDLTDIVMNNKMTSYYIDIVQQTMIEGKDVSEVNYIDEELYTKAGYTEDIINGMTDEEISAWGLILLMADTFGIDITNIAIASTTEQALFTAKVTLALYGINAVDLNAITINESEIKEKTGFTDDDFNEMSVEDKDLLLVSLTIADYFDIDITNYKNLTNDEKAVIDKQIDNILIGVFPSDLEGKTQDEIDYIISEHSASSVLMSTRAMLNDVYVDAKPVIEDLFDAIGISDDTGILTAIDEFMETGVMPDLTGILTILTNINLINAAEKALAIFTDIDFWSSMFGGVEHYSIGYVENILYGFFVIYPESELLKMKEAEANKEDYSQMRLDEYDKEIAKLYTDWETLQSGGSVTFSVRVQEILNEQITTICESFGALERILSFVGITFDPSIDLSAEFTFDKLYSMIFDNAHDTRNAAIFFNYCNVDINATDVAIQVYGTDNNSSNIPLLTNLNMIYEAAEGEINEVRLEGNVEKVNDADNWSKYSSIIIKNLRTLSDSPVDVEGEPLVTDTWYRAEENSNVFVPSNIGLDYSVAEKTFAIWIPENGGHLDLDATLEFLDEADYIYVKVDGLTDDLLKYNPNKTFSDAYINGEDFTVTFGKWLCEKLGCDWYEMFESNDMTEEEFAENLKNSLGDEYAGIPTDELFTWDMYFKGMFIELIPVAEEMTLSRGYHTLTIGYSKNRTTPKDYKDIEDISITLNDVVLPNGAVAKWSEENEDMKALYNVDLDAYVDSLNDDNYVAQIEFLRNICEGMNQYASLLHWNEKDVSIPTLGTPTFDSNKENYAYTPITATSNTGSYSYATYSVNIKEAGWFIIDADYTVGANSSDYVEYIYPIGVNSYGNQIGETKIVYGANGMNQLSENDVTSVEWINASNDTYYFESKNGGYTSTNHNVHGTTATSTFTTTVNENTPFSIAYSCGSESVSYDYLTITLDGSQKVKAGGSYQENTLTGTLTPGTHTLVMSYKKDGSVNGDIDCANIYLNKEYALAGDTKSGTMSNTVYLNKGTYDVTLYVSNYSGNANATFKIYDVYDIYDRHIDSSITLKQGYSYGNTFVIGDKVENTPTPKEVPAYTCYSSDAPSQFYAAAEMDYWYVKLDQESTFDIYYKCTGSTENEYYIDVFDATDDSYDIYNIAGIDFDTLTDIKLDESLPHIATSGNDVGKKAITLAPGEYYIRAIYNNGCSYKTAGADDVAYIWLPDCDNADNTLDWQKRESQEMTLDEIEYVGKVDGVGLQPDEKGTENYVLRKSCSLIYGTNLFAPEQKYMGYEINESDLPSFETVVNIGGKDMLCSISGWYYDKDYLQEALPGDVIEGDTILYPRVDNACAVDLPTSIVVDDGDTNLISSIVNKETGTLIAAYDRDLTVQPISSTIEMTSEDQPNTTYEATVFFSDLFLEGVNTYLNMFDFDIDENTIFVVWKNGNKPTHGTWTGTISYELIEGPDKHW